ncbi:MAG TPA: M48 family metallopeptidase [Actinomycetota bacterium]|nr:M48 family metallopeptidase [Actinomycetota bacterium]
MSALSNPRAFVIIAVSSLLAAGVLALVSRAPASVRAEPQDTPADTQPELGAEFTDEQIARHGAYRGPSYLFFALITVLEVLILVTLARGPFARIVDRFGGLPGGWLVRAAAATLILVLIMWIATLPMNLVRGYAMEHAWGLSTQNLGGWISDQLRATAIGSLVAIVASLVFFTLVRWQPRSWWLIGWVTFTLLSALLAFLWPILIAPLFNKFTPLQDPFLRERAFTLAREADVDIDEVLVADASRRTTTENAYVAGIGASQRLVLYDNLVDDSDPREVSFVIAHELGHRSENHLIKQVLIQSLGLAVGFGVLRLLAGWDRAWEWAGAGSRGIDDVRALPVLLLVTLVLGTLSLPLQNAISRRFEEEADRIAIRLTDDPETAVAAFRRLALANLADLRPPRIAVEVLFSHPPIPERIRDALAASRS